jgi:hypothetical protein
MGGRSKIIQGFLASINWCFGAPPEAKFWVGVATDPPTVILVTFEDAPRIDDGLEILFVALPSEGANKSRRKEAGAEYEQLVLIGEWRSTLRLE